jgi:hypothetical protein
MRHYGVVVDRFRRRCPVQTSSPSLTLSLSCLLKRAARMPFVWAMWRYMLSTARLPVSLVPPRSTLSGMHYKRSEGLGFHWHLAGPFSQPINSSLWPPNIRRPRVHAAGKEIILIFVKCYFRFDKMGRICSTHGGDMFQSENVSKEATSET